MKTVNLQLNIEEANLILEALGNLPFRGSILWLQRSRSKPASSSVMMDNRTNRIRQSKSGIENMPAEQFFLGTGWSFPPEFSKGGAGVKTVSGSEDIHQSLQILLTTQLGERVMQDQFGCDLNRVLFEEINQGFVNMISNMISDAILYHEPRVKLDRLDVNTSESQQGLVLINMQYTVPSTNSRFNMVFPFYVNEASLPGI